MRQLRVLMTSILIVSSGCASLAQDQTSATPVFAKLTVPNPSAPALPPTFIRTPGLAGSNLANDPVLDALLAQVPDSPDVTIAQGRLTEARARLGAARAGLLPSLSGSVAGSQGDGGAMLGTSSSVISSSLQIPIDLFGANRGRVSASRARADQAAYAKDRVIAETRATLSQLYVELRTAQAQIVVTQANQASATDSLSLATARQRAGLETGLAVAQANSNRDAIAARLPGFQQAQIAAQLGIEALLGKPPDTLSAKISTLGLIPQFDLARTDIAPDLWLRTRADLRAAQLALDAAGLDARAAQRDRYPSLSLTALLSQTQASNGMSGSVGLVSGTLLSTLFDFGRLDALARASGAIAQTQAALYRRTIVYALADVETQASRVRQGQAAIDANNANVASAQDQARLASIRYTSGLSGFLEVLTAQRAVYDAQSAQAQAKGETALAQVALNLALGL